MPTYPPLDDITALTQGLATLLDMEQAPSAAVWGLGSGGMVAQVFAMRFPARVSKLILSGAGPLLASRVPVRVLSFIVSAMAALPERAVKGLYQAMLSQVIVVPKPEKAWCKSFPA